MSVDNRANLRPVTAQDLPLIREWRNSPSIRENMYTTHEISEVEHMSWWERVKDAKDKLFFIYEAEENPLGFVSYQDIDILNGTASWAFYASPQARRGTGSLMEMEALDYAFIEMDLHKLWCEVLSFNEAVIKMHRKFGFQIEGTRRQHYARAGKRYDIFQLGLLAHEWLDNRAVMQERLRRKEDKHI